MRRLALGLTLLHAGCESCDFSFGPVPITVVVVSPTDRAASVTVCPEEQGCTTVTTYVVAEIPDTGSWTPPTGYGGDPGPGTAKVPVSWHGYTTCRVPALDITVEAEGCAPEVITTERATEAEARTTFEVALDCG